MISFEEYSSYDGLGLVQLVKNKEVKPEELLEAAVKGIEKLNPELNKSPRILGDFSHERFTDIELKH